MKRRDVVAAPTPTRTTFEFTTEEVAEGMMDYVAKTNKGESVPTGAAWLMLDTNPDRVTLVIDYAEVVPGCKEK